MKDQLTEQLKDQLKGPDEALERRCLAVGDLVAEVLPGPEGPPAGLPAELAAQFAGVSPRRARWRRPAAFSFLAVAAAAGVVVWMTVRARPLEFAVDGAQAEPDGFFEAAGRQSVRARFSDGTVIALAPGSSAQVKTCTHDGATVSMTRGTGSFAVKHRPNASWHVEVGRFDIAVTGTEFEVRNANPAEGFELRMKSGAVIVRGPLTGTGIPLYAGQRLVASLSQRTLVVGEVNGTPTPPPPARPLRAADAREELPRRPHLRAKATALASAESEAPEAQAPPAPRGVLQPPRFEPGSEAPVAPAAPPIPPSTPPSIPPSTPQPPSVEPFVAPPPPVLAVGGPACDESPAPQISFDRNSELAGVAAGLHSAMANPIFDGTHSWCGGHSLRLDLFFDSAGPLQGEAILKLPQMVDLRGRTVTVHLYVDGPADARFDARVLADDVGRRAGNTYAPGLVPGRWYTVSTTFHGPSGIFEPRANVASASQIQALVVRLDTTGDRRTWSGTIYIDHVSWR